MSDLEIRKLRGMIDDHENQLVRRRIMREFWTTGRIITVALAGLAMFVLQFIAAVYAIRGGH